VRKSPAVDDDTLADKQRQETIKGIVAESDSAAVKPGSDKLITAKPGSGKIGSSPGVPGGDKPGSDKGSGKASGDSSKNIKTGPRLPKAKSLDAPAKPGSDPKLPAAAAAAAAKPAPAKKTDTGGFNFLNSPAAKSGSNPAFPAVSLPKSGSGPIPSPAAAKPAPAKPANPSGPFIKTAPAVGVAPATAAATEVVKKSAGVPIWVWIAGGSAILLLVVVGIVVGVMMSGGGSPPQKDRDTPIRKIVPKNPGESDTSRAAPQHKPGTLFAPVT
jgi:hypothetical protein